MAEGRAVIPARPGSQYTAEQIRAAAAHYVVVGSDSAVERITGIPNNTLCGWRKQEWWQSLVEEIRDEKQEEIDALYTNAIHRAVEVTLDRLEHGDPKLLKVKRDGEEDYEEHRVPISGRDAIMISAIAFDKRQIIRNLPTSISASSSEELKQLREQFASLSGKVVEGEVIEDK